MYHHALKPEVKAAWDVPTVEDPPTIVPTIPPKTRKEDTDFFPLKSFPFCFFVDIALTESIRIRMEISPKYIIFVFLLKFYTSTKDDLEEETKKMGKENCLWQVFGIREGIWSSLFLSMRVLGFLLKKEYGEPFGNGKGSD